ILSAVGQWPMEVVSSALQVLNDVSLMWEYIRADNKNCARDLVMALCRYIDISLLPENVVTLQLLTIRAYDCMIRWALLDDWIVHDRECHNTVIATLCRGIGVLDRDDDFASVSTTTLSSHSTLTPALPTPVFSPIIIKEFDASSNSPPIVHTGFATFSSSSDKKKAQKSQTAASKLFVKVRASTPVAPTVSTGTKDAGLGLPTFATLSAEMGIKIAAETALGQLANHLGCFPPWGEFTGVSRLSSMWNEEREVRRLVGVRERLKGGGNHDGKVGGEEGVKVGDYKRFMRYFAYDNRLIIGLIEIPHW
ncbi:hypothetical protein HK097_006241, partial [Rhizophlyctis rosea]